MAAHDVLIATNVGVHAPMLISDSNTAFNYPGWTTLTNHSKQFRDVNPQITPTTGLAMFTIPKVADKIGILALLWQWGPLVLNGATPPGGITAGYYRLCDWAPYQLIQRIEFTYLSNLLQTITGEELFIRTKTRKDLKEEQAEGRRALGGIPATTRDMLATMTQNIIIEIPVYWKHDPSQYFDVNALSHEITMTVYFNNTTMIVQSNYNNAASITVPIVSGSMKIRHYEYGLEEHERVQHLAKSQMENGIVLKSEELELQQRNVIPSGTAGGIDFVIKLTALKSPCYDLRFMVRTVAQVLGSSTQLAPYENLLSVLQWKLTANGRDIIPYKDTNFNLNWDEDIYYPTYRPNYIYGEPFALHPTDSMNASGMVTPGYLNDLSLIIQLPANATQDLQVDVYSFIHNFIQTKGGDIQRVFR
jgi:hypothetical protein